MHLWVDTAVPAEIEEWNDHPWITGFTTNPTLIRQAGSTPKELVGLTSKWISIDGGPEVLDLGERVYRKVPAKNLVPEHSRVNWTAVCSVEQAIIRPSGDWVISVFAGRIMDTGRDPQPVIDAALGTGSAVLWASVREPYNILQAEQAGCDIVTVPPVILRKYLEWDGKPLEVVAIETIAQFERDAQ